MDNAIVWVIVGVAAVVVIALIAFAAWSTRNKRRHLEAERLRGEIGEQTRHVERREGVAVETEAKARAAQAEAEAKAAEAARLQDSARTHHAAVTSSRDELDAQRERADALDPKASAAEAAPGKEFRTDPGRVPVEQRSPEHSRRETPG